MARRAESIFYITRVWDSFCFLYQYIVFFGLVEMYISSRTSKAATVPSEKEASPLGVRCLGARASARGCALPYRADARRRLLDVAPFHHLAKLLWSLHNVLPLLYRMANDLQIYSFAVRQSLDVPELRLPGLPASGVLGMVPVGELTKVVRPVCWRPARPSLHHPQLNCTARGGSSICAAER